MVQLNYTGQQLDQAIRKVRSDADVYTIMNSKKYGTGGTATTYGISVTATHLTASGSNPTTILEDTAVTLVFTADGTDYRTPATASVTNATATYVKTSATKCSLIISNPTGNVSVSITGTQIQKTTFTVVTSDSYHNSVVCETGMTWEEYASSGLQGSTNVSITNNKVYFQDEQVFTSSAFTTAVDPTSTITATTYYSQEQAAWIVGSWLINASPNSTMETITQPISFTAYEGTFTSITIDVSQDGIYYDSTKVYDFATTQWIYEGYRTINIPTDTAVSSPFLSWLTSNAIQL